MARIEESKRTYIEELATNPRVNLMVLSERINIAFHEDESEVSLSEKIAEKFYDMPQLINKIITAGSNRIFVAMLGYGR